MSLGGIEAGGTKWVLAVAEEPGELRVTVTIPTTDPVETIDLAGEFFRKHDDLEAIGIGSFGPVDLNESSPHYGSITTTPKPGWAGTDLMKLLSAHVDVPLAIDTDVNAAALGEHSLGAARGLQTFCYITVGTGIGGGAMVHGELLHGLLHPEFGHMRIPHDTQRDPFPGSCPFHGDCFEGLASGEAIRARWGRGAELLEDEEAWSLEAEYIALGVINVVSTLSPQRVILGGGVMNETALLPMVRTRAAELAAGYFAASELAEGIDEFIVAPALGNLSGVIGALELARGARSRYGTSRLAETATGQLLS